jgi:putative transcriptional regulator
VSLARALIRRGVTPSLARHVAERLLAGHATPVWLPHYDGAVLAHELDAIGVDLKTPEPVTGESLAALRKHLHLSQEQFANSVGLELRTLQNWEQNRVAFDAPTALLIKLLERLPNVVQRVAADEPRDGTLGLRRGFQARARHATAAAILHAAFSRLICS